MKIALKEASETLYWLRLCENMEDIKVQEETLNGLNEIMATFQDYYYQQKFTVIHSHTLTPSHSHTCFYPSNINEKMIILDLSLSIELE
jgi:hypothetical protein